MFNDYNNGTNQQGSNVDKQTIHTGGDPSSTSGQVSEGSDLSFDRSGNAGSVNPIPKQGAQVPQESVPEQLQNGSSER